MHVFSKFATIHSSVCVCVCVLLEKYLLTNKRLEDSWKVKMLQFQVPNLH